MEALPGLVVVFALIGANGYFVAAEFAFVAARRTRLRELRDGGDRRAGRALAVIERLSFMLSGAQLGITVSSLLVGYVAEPTLGRLLQPGLETLGVPQAASLAVALTVALILATGVQMVVGELAPKNLAIARAEPISRALAPSTLLYLRVAGPVIRLFDGSSNALLRLIGIEPIEELPGGADPEELQHIITQSSREGSLTTTQSALLGRALEFRELRAADALQPRNHVVHIPADASGADLRALALESGHSRFLVVGDDPDDVQGLVQARDLLGVPYAQRDTTPVSALATEPLAVPDSTPLPQVLVELRAARSPLALIVDEHGDMAGIVTLEDIVEELVGDIRDEYDPAEPHVVTLADGTYEVPGSWRLDEIARDTGVELPEGDYDTLSGFVMAHLGRMPLVDDVVDVPSATVRVTELEGHAVSRAVLIPRGESEEP